VLHFMTVGDVEPLPLGDFAAVAVHSSLLRMVSSGDATGSWNRPSSLTGRSETRPAPTRQTASFRDEDIDLLGRVLVNHVERAALGDGLANHRSVDVVAVRQPGHKRRNVLASQHRHQVVSIVLRHTPYTLLATEPPT